MAASHVAQTCNHHVYMDLCFCFVALCCYNFSLQLPFHSPAVDQPWDCHLPTLPWLLHTKKQELSNTLSKQIQLQLRWFSVGIYMCLWTFCTAWTPQLYSVCNILYTLQLFCCSSPTCNIANVNIYSNVLSDNLPIFV